jgi:hypothetical protein
MFTCSSRHDYFFRIFAQFQYRPVHTVLFVKYFVGLISKPRTSFELTKYQPIRISFFQHMPFWTLPIGIRVRDFDRFPACFFFIPALSTIKFCQHEVLILRQWFTKFSELKFALYSIIRLSWCYDPDQLAHPWYLIRIYNVSC